MMVTLSSSIGECSRPRIARPEIELWFSCMTVDMMPSMPEAGAAMASDADEASSAAASAAMESRRM